MSIENLQNIANSYSDPELPLDDEIDFGSVAGVSASYANFEELDVEAEQKARAIIINTCAFYLNDEMLNDEYVKNRIEFDISNLKDQIFSLITTLHVIKKILTDIDQGDTSPRKIEAYSTLVSQKKDINKQIALLQVYLSESYKKLELDWKERNNKVDSKDIRAIAKGMIPSAELKGTPKEMFRQIFSDNSDDVTDE